MKGLKVEDWVWQMVWELIQWCAELEFGPREPDRKTKIAVTCRIRCFLGIRTGLGGVAFNTLGRQIAVRCCIPYKLTVTTLRDFMVSHFFKLYQATFTKVRAKNFGES